MTQGNESPFYWGSTIGILLVLATTTVLVQARPAEAETEINAEVTSIDSYFWSHSIDINSHSNKVYIASSSYNELAIYDATDFAKIGSIPENYYSFMVAVNPVTDMIYVSHSCICEQAKLITIIDGKTDNVIGRIDGVMHGNLFVDTVGNKVYSINGTAISVIDGTSNSILDTQKIGIIDDLSVFIMTINPLTNKGYGVDQNKTIVSLDLDTYEITPTNLKLTAERYPDAIDNFVRDMAISPTSNLLYVIDEPQYDCVEFCFPIGYLVTVNASSGNPVSNSLGEIGGFWKDLTIDTKSNVVYIMNGPAFIAINATTNSIIDNYYIPEMVEYVPRAILINTENGSVSLVAPDGAVTIPALENIPEFGPSEPETLPSSIIDVKVGNKMYPLFYDMSDGGTIDYISAEPYLTLVLNITSPSNGTLELTFPRELYDALSFTEHNDPLAVLDGVFADELVAIDSSCEQTSLTVPVQAGTREVEFLFSDTLDVHTHNYPEKIDLFKTIEEEGQKFNVRLVTDAKKCDISFVREEKNIHVDIKGRDEAAIIDEGYFRLTVPHGLLGGNYTVLVDGEPTSFIEDQFFTKNSTDIGVESAIQDDFTPIAASHLSFNYSKDSTAIDIIGTTAVPAFSLSVTGPVGAMSVAVVLVAFRTFKQQMIK